MVISSLLIVNQKNSPKLCFGEYLVVIPTDSERRRRRVEVTVIRRDPADAGNLPQLEDPSTEFTLSLSNVLGT